jgi:hypothetical protein
MSAYLISWIRNAKTGTGRKTPDHVPIKSLDVRRSRHVADLLFEAMRWTTSSTDGYLVDPASSHMLVSKIKPCMCKYELIQTVKLRMAH